MSKAWRSIGEQDQESRPKGGVGSAWLMPSGAPLAPFAWKRGFLATRLLKPELAPGHTVKRERRGDSL